jgi:hypothetical protein
MSGQDTYDMKRCDSFVDYILKYEKENVNKEEDRLTREQITDFGRKNDSGENINSEEVDTQIRTYILSESTEFTHPSRNDMGACPEYNSPTDDQFLNIGGKKRRSFRRKMSKKKKGGKKKRKRTQKKKKGGKRKSTRKQKRT